MPKNSPIVPITIARESGERLSQLRTASLTFQRGGRKSGHVKELGALQERPILLSSPLLATEVDQHQQVKQLDRIKGITRDSCLPGCS
jgi:hypothetical protein